MTIGKPIEDAPKDKEILVLDTDDQFRIVQWSDEGYFDRPRGWQDDEQRFVTPKMWWPLPLPVDPVREAAQIVHDKFKKDIEQGYKTRDKEYAVEILGKALEDK